MLPGWLAGRLEQEAEGVSRGSVLEHSLRSSLPLCIPAHLLTDFNCMMYFCNLIWKRRLTSFCFPGVPPVPSVSGEVRLHWTARNPGNWCKAPAEAPGGGSSHTLPIRGPRPHDNQLGNRLVCTDSPDDEESTVRVIWTWLWAVWLFQTRQRVKQLELNSRAAGRCTVCRAHVSSTYAQPVLPLKNNMWCHILCIH